MSPVAKVFLHFALLLSTAALLASLTLAIWAAQGRFGNELPFASCREIDFTARSKRKFISKSPLRRPNCQRQGRQQRCRREKQGKMKKDFGYRRHSDRGCSQHVPSVV